MVGKLLLLNQNRCQERRLTVIDNPFFLSIFTSSFFFLSNSDPDIFAYIYKYTFAYIHINIYIK